jgi:hypothetical protein
MSLCVICERELGSVRIGEHHLIPKTFGGKGNTILIHDICHAKLHTTITEREMLKYYHTVERLLEHNEIQKFIKWVKNKDIEFYNKNEDTIYRKYKRRR